MAFSLAVAGAAAAQQPLVRPSPVTYDVKISPWPTKAKFGTQPAPFTPPNETFVPPPPPEFKSVAKRSPAPVAATPTSAPKPSRTLYYKKDSNAPVKPWAAAELTRPIAAAEPPMAPAQPAPPPRQAEATAPVAESFLPRTDVMFRLDSEMQFAQRVNDERARMRADPTIPPEKKRDLDRKIEFPEHRALAMGPFPGRFFVAQTSWVEPNYVCFRRLFFEDRNTERYGWTLGPLQPFASTWKFFGDVQNLPYKFGSFPCLRHECSAGLCLPGDPVPMMIYPPGLSLTGAATQAAVTLALYFIVP